MSAQTDAGSHVLAQAGPITFTDVTASAGISTGPTTTWGVQWGDYDNDGYADLFVSRHAAVPALYHNNRDGTFTDVTPQAGMAVKTDRHGCAWGDYNADTYLDLYCSAGAHRGTGEAPNQLFRNNTDGTFTEVAGQLGVVDGPGRGRTANWLDYDGDGQLDLYVGDTWRDGFPARLFRGLNGSFVDVAAEAGVADRFHLNASAWADYDGDSDPDLLVVAFGRLILHKNRGDGTFTASVAIKAKLTAAENLSAAWGDFNSDGYPDLFVARRDLPSVLYQNNGDGTFRDVTASSSIALSNARLGLWGDYNNDGDLDLFVVNGYSTTLGQNVADSLLISNGDGTFTDVAAEAGVIGPTTGAGDSAAWADYNKDGFLDLFVANGEGGSVPPGPVTLYRNNGNSNHWLELRLRGITNNTYGYGARVSITAGAKAQVREFTDGVAQYGQSEQIVHFGLGSATEVSRIVIRWPDGRTQTLTNVAADQILTVCQPP